MERDACVVHVRPVSSDAVDCGLWILSTTSAMTSRSTRAALRPTMEVSPVGISARGRPASDVETALCRLLSRLDFLGHDCSYDSHDGRFNSS